MSKIIKADLIRVFKDKLFIVLLIICVIMSLMMPSLYGIIALSTNGTRDSISSASLALAAFSPLSDFGLLLSIFVIIILCKDFTNGTMRNKIICGKSRLAIYTSNIITTIAFTLFFCVLYFLCTLGVSLIFFNMKLSTPELVGQFFASIGFELLGWIALSFVMAFFSTVIQTSGLSCVLYIALGLVCTLGGSILGGSRLALEYTEGAENVVKTLRFIEIIDIPYAMSSYIGINVEGFLSLQELFGSGINYNLEFCLEYSISCIAICGIFYGLGYLIFRHKNLK